MARKTVRKHIGRPPGATNKPAPEASQFFVRHARSLTSKMMRATIANLESTAPDLVTAERVWRTASSYVWGSPQAKPAEIKPELPAERPQITDNAERARIIARLLEKAGGVPDLGKGGAAGAQASAGACTTPDISSKSTALETRKPAKPFRPPAVGKTLRLENKLLLKNLGSRGAGPAVYHLSALDGVLLAEGNLDRCLMTARKRLGLSRKDPLSAEREPGEKFSDGREQR